MASQLLAHCLPEVREFLDSGPLKGVFGGRDVESSNGETLTTLDPGSKEPLATVYAMQPDDVDRVVRAAAAAFSDSGWASMAANERGVLLHRLADAVEKRKSVLAQIEALDAGKVLGQAEGDVQNFVATLRYYTDLALHVQRRSPLAVARHEAWITRQPWGPCGFIFPWNFPILLIGWNISPALAAGNTVVIKPAEDTPLSAIYLARLAREVGIPDGVINVVPGYGPVAYLAAFADEDEAVRMANGTDYGLANSVWTSDLTRACRVAEAMLAGNSWINAHNLFPHGVPYAGVNKSGLGGGVLSVETLFDYWRNLSVVRPL